MKTIKYEPHPVSPERKAELVAAGFKIIDARFAPAGAAEAVDVSDDGLPAVGGAVEAPRPRRGRPRKVEG
jgi:hypothetical protein